MLTPLCTRSGRSSQTSKEFSSDPQSDLDLHSCQFAWRNKGSITSQNSTRKRNDADVGSRKVAPVKITRFVSSTRHTLRAGSHSVHYFNRFHVSSTPVHVANLYSILSSCTAYGEYSLSPHDDDYFDTPTELWIKDAGKQQTTLGAGDRSRACNRHLAMGEEWCNGDFCIST